METSTVSLQQQRQALKSRTESDFQKCDGKTQEQFRRFQSTCEAKIQQQCQALESKIQTAVQRERDWVVTQLNLTVACPYDEDGSLRGIISYLTQACGGNVVDKGVIGVDGSPGRNPRNAFDFQNKDSYYFHQAHSEQWLIVDFRERRIVPTHYSIRGSTYYEGMCAPKSWVLEGALEGDNWVELDRQETEGQVRDATRAFTFMVSNRQSCKRLRFRKTSGCHTPCDYLLLTALEFFGRVSH
jgi:hypothetical protein